MLTQTERDHIMRTGWVVDHMLYYVHKHMPDYDNLPIEKQQCLKQIISMSVSSQRNYIIIQDKLELAKKHHVQYQYYETLKSWRVMPRRRDAKAETHIVKRNLSPEKHKKV
jgi:hypothetical protein